MKRELATIERLRLETQTSLDGERTAVERNRLGQFATPGGLADEIARVALDLMGDDVRAVRFFEPSVGSGAFFSALLRHVGQRQLKSATGIEIDKRFAAPLNGCGRVAA